MKSNFGFTPTWFHPFNKDNLKPGDTLVLRNGDQIVLDYDKEFYELSKDNHNGLYDLDDLTENLTYIDGDRDYDVVKVLRPKAIEIVFERIDKAREMTIEEISDELGYDVKIVKKK